MTRAIFVFLALVLSGLMSGVANADSFGVTLRYWLTNESSANSAQVTQFFAVKTNDARLEVPAITLRWSPDGWANHDILLSYFKLDSTRDGDFLVATSFPATFVTNELETKRSDIELLVRSRAGENFFYYYGLRYINPQSIAWVPYGSQRNILEDKWYLAEFGLGLALPVSENGRHSLFANAIGGIGHYEQDQVNQIEGVPDTAYSRSETGHTIDLNFGYQYTMNQKASFSLRYRDWSSYLGGDQQIASAGMDLGVTIDF
jgi:hypothetical protein